MVYVGRPAFGQEQNLVSLFRVNPDGDEATRVKVRLGKSSVNTVQILEGLKPGDKVILSDMSAWDAYDRVRLKSPPIPAGTQVKGEQMSANGQPVIRLEGVTKVFFTDEVETHALSGVHLDIRNGEFVSIAGPSGCGKSTLLSILGLLDSPSDGSYILNGKPAQNLNLAERARIRNREIGFIFQSFNLIGDLSVFENVELPLTYRGMGAGERKKRVQEALEKVGMAHRMRHFPSQLSGGQQQRVAVARAIVGQPLILLADEPTGNLDSVNGEAVMSLLQELHRNGATICMVTHDPRFARHADRTIRLFDGRVVDEEDAERAHDEKELVESGFRIDERRRPARKRLERHAPGPATGRPHAGEVARVHDRRGRDPGARHRREHRDLLGRPLGTLARTSPTPPPSGSSASGTSGRPRPTPPTRSPPGLRGFGTRVPDLRVREARGLHVHAGPHRDEPHGAPASPRVSRRPTSLRSSFRRSAYGRFGARADSAEGVHGRDSVVVLARRTWADKFGADPAIVGKTIRLGDRPFTVVGVMAADFAFPASSVDAWAPLSLVGEDDVPHRRDVRWLGAVGRLRPGVSPAAVRGGVDTLFRRLAREHPDSNTGFERAAVQPLREALLGEVRRPLLLLLGAVGMVLLILCANLGGLLLARGSARRREIAIRSALGASRARIVRHLVLEALLLSLAGAFAGLLLAVWIVSALPAFASALPRAAEIRLDGAVLAFTFILSIVAGLAFGLVPALRVARPDLSAALESGGRLGGPDRGQRRLLRLLVVAECLLAGVLLTGAGLLGKSFWLLTRVDSGVRPEGVLALSITIPERYFQTTSWRSTWCTGWRS